MLGLVEGHDVYCGQQYKNNIVHNQVLFTNCSWLKNFAAISPAVDVSPGYIFLTQTQYIVKVTFNDCIFFENRVNQYYYSSNNLRSLPTMMQYTGAFLAMQVPVNFAGYTVWFYKQQWNCSFGFLGKICDYISRRLECNL